MSDMYHVKMLVADEAPEEYKRHAWDTIRREAGNKLYSLLEQSRMPAVVEIDESVEHSCANMYSDELYIKIRLTPVEHRHVVMEKMSAVEFHMPHKPTFMQRLRWLVTGK